MYGTFSLRVSRCPWFHSKGEWLDTVKHYVFGVCHTLCPLCGGWLHSVFFWVGWVWKGSRGSLLFEVAQKTGRNEAEEQDKETFQSFLWQTRRPICLSVQGLQRKWLCCKLKLDWLKMQQLVVLGWRLYALSSVVCTRFSSMYLVQ